MTNKLPGEKYSEQINARFWLTENDTYLGIGRITLLEKIAETGSISGAAKEMKMSYKKAWKIIDDINGIYKTNLVVREQGGKSGGGTHLTQKGQEVVRSFRQLENKLREFLIKESSKINL